VRGEGERTFRELLRAIEGGCLGGDTRHGRGLRDYNQEFKEPVLAIDCSQNPWFDESAP
jgi:hypothetical protein